MRPSASPSGTKTMAPHKSYILFCCSAAFVHTEWSNLNNVICLGTDLSHLSTTMAAPYFWICFFPVSDPRLSLTRAVCKHTSIRAFTQPSTHCLKGKQPFETGTGSPHRLFGRVYLEVRKTLSVFLCVSSQD